MSEKFCVNNDEWERTVPEYIILYTTDYATCEAEAFPLYFIDESIVKSNGGYKAVSLNRDSVYLLYRIKDYILNRMEYSEKNENLHFREDFYHYLNNAKDIIDYSIWQYKILDGQHSYAYLRAAHTNNLSYVFSMGTDYNRRRSNLENNILPQIIPSVMSYS